MAVAYVGSSAGIADISGAWSETKTGCTVGNVIIGQAMADGDTTGTTQTLGSCTGIENLAGTDNTMTVLASADVGGNGWQYLWIGRAISSSCVFAGTTAGNDVWLQVHEFSGVHTGTALSDVIENGSAGSVATASGTDASVEDVGVTTLGADRLACNFLGRNDDDPFGDMSGESGGNWTNVATFGDATGTDGMVGLWTATMASAGTINGGTYTFIAADPWGVIGFALVPPSGGGGATEDPFPYISGGYYPVEG